MLTKEYENLIVQTVCRIMVPFIQVYALYVIAHGHYSPGGGFQGGVILTASLALIFLAFGQGAVIRRINRRFAIILCALGVFIYAGIGLFCLLLGGNYLDYAQLAPILGVTVPRARSLGILGVEIGVGLAVMSAMYSIIMDIAGRPATDNDKKSIPNSNGSGERVEPVT